jgi:hypothetical protein
LLVLSVMATDDVVSHPLPRPTVKSPTTNVVAASTIYLAVVADPLLVTAPVTSVS